MYLLWDSSVVIPYYVPEATKNSKAAERSAMILDSIRNHRTDAVCLIPNIVVAEVFSAFDRQYYSSWDSQVSKQYAGSRKSLDKRNYEKARKTFRKHIHNGRLFYQHDLNRYHILALDLIAPVDKYRKFYRTKDVRSMGASDLLIGTMALHLVRLHGRDHVRLLTADRRMKAIFEVAAPAVHPSTRTKMRFDVISKELGFGPWSSSIYPRVIDLERCAQGELIDCFGCWPLETRKTRGKPPVA